MRVSRKKSIVRVEKKFGQSSEFDRRTIKKNLQEKSKVLRVLSLYKKGDLSSQFTDPSNFLDLFLGNSAEVFSANYDGLLGEFSLSKDLGDALWSENRREERSENKDNIPLQIRQPYRLGNINHRDKASLVLGSLLSLLLSNEGPNFVQIDSGLVLGVLGEVVVPHTDLTEITRMVLIKVDAVMMLTTSVTTTTRMLPVLADTTMTSTDVSSKLSGML